MAAHSVALVTGSNKGIGFAVVRGLCKQFNGHVYLTARDEVRGKEAVAKLESEGLNPKFHQLDIDDPNSIERLRKFVQDNYGGLDILVNNAAIYYKSSSSVPLIEQAEMTIRINYWATLNICSSLFPLLRSHARIVNVSSIASKTAFDGCSETLRCQLRMCNSVDDVNRYMDKFVADVKAGDYLSHGWPRTVYGVSKLGVSLVTAMLQQDIDADKSRSDVIFNSCCPGYVATDMSSMKGTKTADEGADTPLYLALLPPHTDRPRGEFVVDRVVTSLW